MGSDSDDADFFDKLVDDDDDADGKAPPAASAGKEGQVPPAAADEAAGAADLAALTLDDGGDEDGAGGTGGAPEPEPAAAVVAPQAAAEDPTDAADPPPPPPHPEAEAPAAPRDAEVLTAAPDADVLAAAPDAEVPAGLPEVKAVAAADPEGRSPGSGSGSGSSKGVRTTVKQVQWSLFGADISSGTELDPFSDLLADGAGHTFLGAGVGGAQASGFGASSVGAMDHSFYNGAGSSNASSQLGWGTGSGEFLADGGVGEDAFFGVQGSAVGTAGSVGAADHSFFNGVDGNANSQSYMGAGVVESVDHQNTNAQSDWTGGAVDPSDPYPGWKWDVATGQWYQVDAVGAQGFADNGGAVAAVGSENVQQQQQHLGVSYLQNSSQAGLETITEEGSAAAASWGQDQSSAAAAEYPPNMLFYAEYPEHYYDTNTQQWFMLESYQQSVVQAATPASAVDAFAGAGHSVVHTGNTQASSFNQQNQWQHGSVANSMQPYTENRISQPAYTEPLKPSTNYGTAINTFVPSLEPSVNYQTNINTFVPSTSQYSGSGEGHQGRNQRA